jgi:hypothetical protein
MGTGQLSVLFGFVPNLQNRQTDGATVSVRESASAEELLFVRL